MELREKIDALVARIAKLGEWTSARDVVDSDDGKPFESDIAELIEQYPFVERASDWLEFLRVYGGGMLTRDEDMLSLGLYGFSDEVSMSLLDGPGEPVELGCLFFGDVVLPRKPIKGPTDETISLGFGFEAGGERPWGIYRVRDRKSEWYCNSFIEWLERFVAREGRLID